MEQSRHAEGLTSVKVHHQPGGASSFSIGGGYGGDDGTADRQRSRTGQHQAAGAAGAAGAQREEQKQAPVQA